MTEVTQSARGSIGPSWWRVAKGDGTVLIEVEPALFGRTVKVSEDRREIERLRKPTGQQPWVEHVLANDEHAVVLVLVWESGGVSSHVFVDGVNLRGGETLDVWRSRAPKPIDRFEQNVLRSSALNEDDDALYSFFFALSVGGAAGWASGSILVWLVVAAGTALVVTGWTWIVRRFARWLGTKPTWHDGLRAEAVFLLMISPLVALVAIAILATSH